MARDQKIGIDTILLRAVRRLMVVLSLLVVGCALKVVAVMMVSLLPVLVVVRLLSELIEAAASTVLARYEYVRGTCNEEKATENDLTW